jgi:hypothetical protein
MKSSRYVPGPIVCFDLVKFNHNSKSSQAVGYDMFGGFTTVGRGIKETRIGVSGDVYKAKAPKEWYELDPRARHSLAGSHGVDAL